MTRTSGASEHEVHQATYDLVDPPIAPGRFECRVVCSCADFERVSTSKVSAAQARSNARTTFTRHVRDLRVAGEAAESAAAETIKQAAAGAARDAVEQASRLEQLRVAQEAAQQEAARVEEEATPAEAQPELQPESQAESQAEPEPEQVTVPVVAGQTSKLRSSSTVLTSARRWLVPALIVAALVLAATIAIFGAGGSDTPAGTDAGAAVMSTGPAPSTESATTPSVAPPTSQREFVDGLRTLDPVFDDFSGPTLVRAGRSICTFYGSGQDVVQIIASIAGRGTLIPQQSATIVRLSSPVFCPQFTKPMTEELDGLG